ncbi:DUF6221 family protein (plasmid) [Nocardia sp. CA-151230]|uniref:DUF6221 family protein n=1 Tax=Nocardia sp. CA-151230 TaxID=3239982 RepID=UPI003D915364
MTIEEFIEARLCEDEDIAAGARRGPRRPDGWSEDYGQEFIVVVGVRDGVPDCVVRSTDESRHIARHDPDRALRQYAALRKIMRLNREDIADVDSGASMQITEAVASIWSDHPDFDPSWAVDGGGSNP